MFFKKREDKVILLMGKHLDKIEEVLQAFDALIVGYCDGSADTAKLRELSFKVHEHEHEADDIRREIQQELIAGAFLPFYRENFLKIPDMVDVIAGDAVRVSKELYLQQLILPNEIKIYMKQLSSTINDTYNKFLEMFNYMPNDVEKVLELAKEVAKNEQRADKLEWEAKKFIFMQENNLDKADKIVYKELITFISGIADRIENAAEYISLTMIKMKL